jgi:hypothetical protein
VAPAAAVDPADALAVGCGELGAVAIPGGWTVAAAWQAERRTPAARRLADTSPSVFMVVV